MTMRHKIALYIACGAMFLLLMVVVFGDNGLIELHRLRSRHADLVSVNERLRQENLIMYRSVERLQNDPVYIEHVARQEFGMIRPDEIIFKFDGE
jgi:cell division protein FtsB